LTKEEIEKDFEQHSIRGQIRQHIAENPGTHFSRIVRNVKAGNGTTTYHLHVLEENGFIKSIKKGPKKYYFETNYLRTTGKDFLYRLQQKLSFTQMEILNALSESATLSVNQIALAIDKSAATASYNIKLLEHKNFVKSHKQKQEKMCSITRKGEKYLSRHRNSISR